MKEKKKARVFTWIHFRESLVINENQSSRKFIHCSKFIPLPTLSNIFNFLKNGKRYCYDVLRYSVFILWPHFRQISCIKFWTFCHIYQVVFNIFNFGEKALISNRSNFWQFFVEILTTRHVDVYSVCLLSENKRSATRFLIHDCLFFLIHDRHREYICIIRT